MDPLTISGLLSLGKSALERLLPDESKRAEELLKLEQIAQKGDLADLDAHVKIILGQLEINLQEAKHPSRFVSGWRPAAGWCGVSSLFYAGVFHPLMTWFWSILQALGYIEVTVLPPPIIDTTVLGTILTGMLGLGTMRSIDKRNRVETNRIG